MDHKKFRCFLALILINLIFINSASAVIEIVDVFSDFTSSDATILSDKDVPHGIAVFQLLYNENIIESYEVPFKLKANLPVKKTVIWQEKTVHDYYTTKVSVYNGSHLFDHKTYQVSYGTVSMPSFHVVDFSPSNKGVKLLLQPFNPSVVDIIIELLDNNDIVYSKTKEDVSLTSNTELEIDWPFLLIDNEKYTVRTKILTHRLYSEPLINTYIAYFIASDDVEIISEDVEVDEYGASITLRGKSQVPFDGFIEILARNRETYESKTFRQQVEEILVAGKEDTSGVVWNNLEPGTYDLNIMAVNKENVTLDKYETVLRIPEVEVNEEIPKTNNTQGLSGLTGFAVIVIVIAALIILKRRGD